MPEDPFISGGGPTRLRGMVSLRAIGLAARRASTPDIPPVVTDRLSWPRIRDTLPWDRPHSLTRMAINP